MMLNMYFDEKENVWKEKKDPFAVIECETEADYLYLRHIVEEVVPKQKKISEQVSEIITIASKYNDSDLDTLLQSLNEMVTV